MDPIQIYANIPQDLTIKLVAHAAQLGVKAMTQQALIAQAQSSGMPLKTVFPTSTFGQALSAIASIINGRSVIGASRQI